MEHTDLNISMADMPAHRGKRGSKDSTASKASKSDDDSKKNGKRGRPRVDSQDQSAVERRRTQIRLAQRAYRERKETTIADLEKRVSQLQKTISNMNQGFMDLHDHSIASGLDSWNPLLAQRFRSTSEKFSTLVCEVEMDADTEEVAPKRKKRNHNASNVSEPYLANISQEEAAPQMPMTPSPEASEVSAPTVNVWGYEFTHDADSNLETGSNVEEVVQQPNEWMGASNELQQYQPGVLNAPAYTEDWLTMSDKDLKPIYTYNFQESSFSRRLLRFSYEKTYHMLTNPSTPPEKIHHLLRYSLCFGSVKTIAQRIKDRLTRTKNDPLEHWEVPVLHIGGAGLHFPRDGIDDTTAPPQGFLVERNVGPFQAFNAARHVPDESFPFDVARWAGIEGVFFDTYDVEMYLRTKGLILDGTSSTAVIEIDDNTVPNTFDVPLGSPNSSSVETLSGPQSPISAGEQVNGFFSPTVDQLLLNEDVGAMDFDFSIFPPIDQGKASSGMMATTINGFSDMSATALQPAKRKLTIDVDRLLETLNEYGVCLGRAPGYKQEDVDTALSRVLQEAW